MRDGFAISRRKAAVWLLIAATLMVRALVPAGWMPAQTESGAITVQICNSDQSWTIPTEKRDTNQHRARESCPFGLLASAADLPDFPWLAAIPVPAGVAYIAWLREIAPRVADRLRPPGRAPPLT